jgi:hypothetical protein
MRNSGHQTEISIISVDAEIHLATYPFEMNFQGLRVVGTMEQRVDGEFRFQWSTRIPSELEVMNLAPVINAILSAYEAQVRSNLEDEIIEEIIQKISK